MAQNFEIKVSCMFTLDQSYNIISSSLLKSIKFASSNQVRSENVISLVKIMWWDLKTKTANGNRSQFSRISSHAASHMSCTAHIRIGIYSLTSGTHSNTLGIIIVITWQTYNDDIVMRGDISYQDPQKPEGWITHPLFAPTENHPSDNF